MAFSISESQYQRLLSRVTALEAQANDMAVAISKFVTLSQVNQLLVISQTDIADLRAIVEALEERVTSIEEEPLS